MRMRRLDQVGQSEHASFGPIGGPRLGAKSWCCLAVLALLLCVAGALRSPAAPSAAETASPSPAAADPDAPGPGAQYVGSGLCGAPACHGAMLADFNQLRHSHYVSDPKLKEAANCEVCHGPASNHVA